MPDRKMIGVGCCTALSPDSMVWATSGKPGKFGNAARNRAGSRVAAPAMNEIQTAIVKINSLVISLRPNWISAET